MTELNTLSSPRNLLKPIVEQFVEEDFEPQKASRFALTDKQKLKISHVIAADNQSINM